jgi:hypothetical protein
MATTETIFAVHTPPPGSQITPAHFIAVRGEVPEWVLLAGIRHNGPVPADRPIFRVDVEAQRREEAAAAVAAQAFQPKDYSEADVDRLTGFTKPEQRTEAIAFLGMPSGRMQFLTDGLAGEVTGTKRVWRSDVFEKWLAIVGRVFPEALPKPKR